MAHMQIFAVCRGQASNGELGYGDKGKKSSANPDKCPVLDDVPTQQVACGVGFNLFLVDSEHEAIKKLPGYEAPDDSPGDGNAPAEAAAKGEISAYRSCLLFSWSLDSNIQLNFTLAMN